MQPTDLCEFYESRGGGGEPVVRLAPVIPKVLCSSRDHVCGAFLSNFVRQRCVVRLVESYVRLRDSIRCARQLNGLTNPRETAGREAQPYDLGLVCSRKEDEDVKKMMRDSVYPPESGRIGKDGQQSRQTRSGQREGFQKRCIYRLHCTVTSVCCLIGSLPGMLLARHSNSYLSCPAGLLMLLIRSVDAPLPVMLVWFGSAQVTLGVGTPLAAHSRIRSPPSRTTFAAGGSLVK